MIICVVVLIQNSDGIDKYAKEIVTYKFFEDKGNVLKEIPVCTSWYFEINTIRNVIRKR